jgi:hypothetical protein
MGCRLLSLYHIQLHRHSTTSADAIGHMMNRISPTGQTVPACAAKESCTDDYLEDYILDAREH